MGKTKTIIERPPTGKQTAFAQAMFTIGLDTFGNGVQSAKKAGYKGNDGTLESIASENLSKPVIIALKTAIQAKNNELLDHNRQIAIDILHEALDIAREKKDNQGIVSACRELDAISALHSQQVNTTNKTLSISVQSKE